MMLLMFEEELVKWFEFIMVEVLFNYVVCYWDMVVLFDKVFCKVIGEIGLFKDKFGFEVDFIICVLVIGIKYSYDCFFVLMFVKGYWCVDWDGGLVMIVFGDIMLVFEGFVYFVVFLMIGEVVFYYIVGIEDLVGFSWIGN